MADIKNRFFIKTSPIFVMGVVGAILGPLPGSGKHGAMAFRGTAARCHTFIK
jgi:hypothetical protein